MDKKRQSLIALFDLLSSSSFLTAKGTFSPFEALPNGPSRILDIMWDATTPFTMDDTTIQDN
jgi:hypothetical protein